MRPRSVLLIVMSVTLVACGGQNRGSGGRDGVPGIPGGGNQQVPPLDPPDTFFAVGTLANRNPNIQTPYLTTSKDSMTATTLDTGHVVIIGGTTGGTALTETDVYEQRMAQFTPSGHLGQARRHHTATLTSSQSLVVIGGVGQSQNPLVSAEIWNPSTGTYQIVQQMGTARVGHTATALPSGEILVVGGFSDGSGQKVTERVEGLNLSTRQWREFTPLMATSSQDGIPGALHVALKLPGPNGIMDDGDDQVIIIGGVQGDRTTKQITSITNRVAVFDPNQTTTPPNKGQHPGRWRSLSITGQNAETARLGAQAFVISTDASHPTTGEETTQVIVIGGLMMSLGTSLGDFTATSVGLSTLEDSPVSTGALTFYVLDIENRSLLGSATPRGDIDASQVQCIGHPVNCPPFVGGFGARATYNAAARMALYTGGNTVDYTIPARVLYNRSAQLIDMNEDLATGYMRPIASASTGTMGDLRSFHISALLPGPDGHMNTVDDTVLVAGGEQNPAGENQTADEYRFP